MVSAQPQKPADLSVVKWMLPYSVSEPDSQCGGESYGHENTLLRLVASDAEEIDGETRQITIAHWRRENGRPGSAVPGRPAPFRERRLGSFAAFQPLPKPVQHLVLNPSHSVRAELYPLGEFAGLFQPCDVLGRI